MKLFFTTSTKYLQHNFTLPSGNCTLEKFPDGEIFVEIKDEVSAQRVVLITATPAPAENLLELFFVLDALQRAHAVITVFFLYFGYARQDKIVAGEASGAHVIAQLLQQFAIQHIFVLHIHNPVIAEMYTMQDVIYWDFFYRAAKTAHIIAAPDAGARNLAKTIGVHTQKEVIFIEKKRISPKEVELKFEGSLVGKTVLIVDDIISTGHTICKTSELMKDHGAERVIVAATHGLLSAHASELLAQSPIDHLYTTNSLLQVHALDFYEVIDVTPFIEQQILTVK